jgi:serine protease Do
MRLLVLPFLLLFALPVSAQQPGLRYVASGTGFFVSKYGHIVTNEHVVHGCNTVMIRGAVPQTEARVLHTDPEIDLALLRTESTPPDVASVRAYGNAIGEGDRVLLVGYPEEHGQTGVYKIVESTVTGEKGPTGQAKWLQFADSARQGNSGGPLLDRSGNVVGVIVGKSELRRVNRTTQTEEVVQKSDIAVSLPYLQEFLEDQNVDYWRMYSGLYNATNFIEQHAKDYIVNIHCVREG